MFDKTSVVMLCMMTFAFLIPCALSYMPGLSFLHTYSYAPASAAQQQQAGQQRAHDPATAHATALQQRQMQQRSGIPPRPPARVQPAA
jgi:hypothetical protein